MTATCVMFYGLGDGATDPSSGEPLLMTKIKALGVTVPPIFDYTAQQAGVDYIAKLPKSEIIFLCAISCGANRLPIVATALGSRKFAGMYMIAPSIYCNAGCPDVPDNAPNTWVFNGPWYLAIPPGLSSYKPNRIAGSKQPDIIRRWSQTWHPCDSDVANVQNPILADIKRLAGAVK
jgi:hypothetical protein